MTEKIGCIQAQFIIPDPMRNVKNNDLLCNYLTGDSSGINLV